MVDLSAIAFNGSLKRSSDEDSSTQRMIDLLESKFSKCGVRLSRSIRLADYNIKAGVTSDEGANDDWPEVREELLKHDILVFGTPIWLGQISSVSKRALERMDAFLSETDDKGRMPSFSKVALAAVVGNEDGAHNVTASLFQALNDTGWTVPASSSCYWVGEAMGSKDFKDLNSIPKKVDETATMAAANAAHLASLLRRNPYEGGSC